MKICSDCYRCYEDREVHCADGSHRTLLEPHVGEVEMIPGYRLERLSWSTARKDLFSASHIASGRSCMIKIIHASDNRVAEFVRDAEIATSLFHPNVVDTYEAGQLENGDLFVVTEDAAGQTLREMMADQLPDLLTAIRLATDIAFSVHTLHLKSLVHRAIRPENIVIARHDYGELLVRVKDPDLGGVSEHSIVSDKFTIDSARDHLRYFSPEQCNGERVGIKSDVYSLGIVLYEMLAGRPPFDSPKASGLIEMHRHRRPAEIRIDDFDLRMLVTHTLMQSLSKHPNDRQSSANAFARQLRHVEQLATHVSTPPPAGVVPPEPLRSSPRIHISDAGQPEIPAVQPDVVEPQRAEDAAVLFVPDEVLQNVAEPVIKPHTALCLTAESGDMAHQGLARLKQRRKRSRGEHKRRAEELPQRTFEVGPAFESQAFCLDDTAEKILSVSREPVKVNWSQPEDDIPSMDAVLTARSEMPVLSEGETHAGTAESVEQQPEPIAVSKARPVRAAAAAASGGIHLSGIFGTSHREPDEITAAPARGNPIRIEIGLPKTVPNRKPVRSIVPTPSEESPYLPTVFGSEAATPTSETSASILSAFYGDEASPSVWPTQKATIAAGVVAVAAALFAFSNVSAWKYLSRSPVDESDSASVTPAIPAQQQAAVTSPPATAPKQPVKYFDSPRPKSNPDAVANQPAKASAPASKSEPVSDSKPDKANASRSIVADRVKNVKPEPSKRPGADRGSTAANKLTATTRPRIVKNPRP